MSIIKKIVGEFLLLRKTIYHRLYITRSEEQDIITSFHQLYYDSADVNKTWSETYWMGTKIWKCPLDLWLYQEILYKLKPDLIIETGTAYGGSASYLASICDLLDNGRIITIDVEPNPDRPQHKRITYVTGSSVDKDIYASVKEAVSSVKTVLVILDSDHHKNHVLEEMALYGPLVTKGSYLIVEDTNMNGHPVYHDFGPGPKEAVEDFLKTDNQFSVDVKQEKFLLTFNPGGYLLKR